MALKALQCNNGGRPHPAVIGARRHGVLREWHLTCSLNVIDTWSRPPPVWESEAVVRLWLRCQLLLQQLRLGHIAAPAKIIRYVAVCSISKQTWKQRQSNIEVWPQIHRILKMYSKKKKKKVPHARQSGCQTARTKGNTKVKNFQAFQDTFEKYIR